MKFLRLLPLFIALLIAGCSEKSTDWHENGQKKDEYTYKDGKMHNGLTVAAFQLGRLLLAGDEA